MLIKKLRDKLNIPEYMTSDEWYDWEIKTRKEYPILYFLGWDLPIYYSKYIVQPISDFIWSIKYRIFPEYWSYWLVRPKTLKVGYNDARELILHSSMQILCDFYEFQKSDKSHICWDSDVSSDHGKVYDEMGKLYNEWKQYLEDRENLFKCPPEFEGEKGDKLFRFKDEEYTKWLRSQGAKDHELDLKEDELLHRLINIRLYMWD